MLSVDYQVGEKVRIIRGKYAGKQGVIMSITLNTSNENQFNYGIKINDRIGFNASKYNIVPIN